MTPTENPLAQEARPPPEADFYDAFQKLKHALNLLVSFTHDNIHILTTVSFYQLKGHFCSTPYTLM